MKLTQPKMIRLGMVLAGVVVLYTLFTSYAGGKGSLLDRAEELGGTGPSAPVSESGPTMGLPFSMGGNAASAEGLQGRTPSSQQTYQETTLDSSELLPKGKIAVLGLMTTKSRELETADELKRRIDEAAKFAPIEQLALSPQCGFSSGIGGNTMTIEEEVAKLKRLVEVTKSVWGTT